jgi:predicted PurR-regulated permease PerM
MEPSRSTAVPQTVPRTDGNMSAPPSLPPQKDEGILDETTENSVGEIAREDMPLPSDLKTVFLGGLFFLACFGVFYVAREIVLPIFLAFFLKLLLQPAVRTLHHVYVPRFLGALLAIALLLGIFVGFGAAVTAPATDWAQKLPEGLPKLEQRLEILTRPINAAMHALQRAERATQSPAPQSITVQENRIAGVLLQGAHTVLSGLFTTAILLFFLLVSGETFLRRVVEILPHFREKRQAVEIAQQVEQDLSLYLVTISLMNSAVGIATGIVMALCGVADPVLWGAMAFLLNYVMILGPLVGIGIFVLVGMLSFDSLLWALLPAAGYLAIHVTEGELITPMLLARRFTLNPVLVILSLIFWFWMWGVPGAVLAVPILAIIKIVSDRIRPLAAFGHFLEG